MILTLLSINQEIFSNQDEQQTELINFLHLNSQSKLLCERKTRHFASHQRTWLKFAWENLNNIVAQPKQNYRVRINLLSKSLNLLIINKLVLLNCFPILLEIRLLHFVVVVFNNKDPNHKVQENLSTQEEASIVFHKLGVA